MQQHPVYKEKIINLLKEFLDNKQKELHHHTWGSDVLKKLATFLSQGKMVRGSLVLFSYTLFEKTISEDVYKAAGALELLHASLLVHDDIMDKDTLRRGETSIFAQYAQKFHDTHVGESMGICVGDIGFFLAYELLSSLQYENTSEIIAFYSKEMTQVALAQMQDVYHGISNKEISEKDILMVYRYKTGRYTFALPLMIGAMLAKQDKHILSQLEELGESLGILFQLKDDELGLFGSTEMIGKPVASDIRQNKKTLYWLFLYKNSSLAQKNQLNKIFGKDTVNEEDLAMLYNIIDTLNTKEKVYQIQKQLEEDIQGKIKKLPFSETVKDQFKQLLQFSMHRGK